MKMKMKMKMNRAFSPLVRVNMHRANRAFTGGKKKFVRGKVTLFDGGQQQQNTERERETWRGTCSSLRAARNHFSSLLFLIRTPRPPLRRGRSKYASAEQRAFPFAKTKAAAGKSRLFLAVLR